MGDSNDNNDKDNNNGENDKDDNKDDNKDDDKDQKGAEQEDANAVATETYKDQGFEHYLPSSSDPSGILIGTAVICTSLFIFSVLFLSYRHRWRQRRRKAKKRKRREKEQRTIIASNFNDEVIFEESEEVSEEMGCILPAKNFVPQRRPEASRLVGWTTIASECGNQATEVVFEEEGIESDVLETDLFERGGVIHRFRRRYDTEALVLEDSPISQFLEATSDYNIMPQKDGTGGCSYPLYLLTYDRQTKKLLRLALPYTLSALIEGVFDLMTMGLIGRRLGTGPLTAYLVVTNAFGLSSMLLSGLIASLTTICSQAVGSRQHALAGQLVQIGVSLYLIGFLPQWYLWYNYVDEGMSYLGFEYDTCMQAQEYARIYFVAVALETCYTSFEHLLEVTDFERFVTVSGCIHSAVCFAVTLFLVSSDEVPIVGGAPTLFILGVFDFAVLFFFFSFNLMYIKFCHGSWWKLYAPGLFGSIGLTQTKTVKFFLQASAPLSFGHILSYGEWQVLFVLAGHLGPAEVAVWGILGEIWATMEDLTYAWGDAAEVRCAKLLGAGRGKTARLAAHKGMLLAAFAALVVSLSVAASLSDLPTWFTNDEVLQKMLGSALPLVAMGNVALALGTTSFQLVGAQARYSLATAVQFVGSWLVTLPLALVSAFALEWNMEGLVAAVVVGYMVSGSINLIILCSTNWKTRAQKIAAKHRKLAPSAGSHTDGSGSESMSESSSSQSSESTASQTAEQNTEMGTPNNETRSSYDPPGAPRDPGGHMDEDDYSEESSVHASSTLQNHRVEEREFEQSDSFVQQADQFVADVDSIRNNVYMTATRARRLGF